MKKIMEVINEFLAALRNKNIQFYGEKWDEYCLAVQTFASHLFNKKNGIGGYELSEEEIQTFDSLIRICNILYNMTDLEVLPIEDGVYDILLEYYKKFNPNFQVGSEVINFAPTNSENKIEEKINPLKFYSDDEWNKMENGFFYKDIQKIPELCKKDFNKSPIIFNSNITKRKHNTKNNHPELVGTLDKCKFVLMEDAIKAGVDDDPTVKVLERDFFANHIMNEILDPNRKIKMVLELKYDGVSVEADCNNTLVSARSRGDTGIGEASDITPILFGYPFCRATEFISEKPIGIKFEAIMTYSDLERFNRDKNYYYKNCRTAIIGLFGSGDAWKYRDYITLIPLAIDRNDIPGVEWNRELEIEFLNKYFSTKGQPLRYAIIEGDYRQCLFLIKRFLEEAEVARNFLNFMYDGIVVSYMDEDIREVLGRKNYINKYSMAVKFNPLCKQTIFRGYTYTIGQDGSITPMIHYDQVEFYGTIHNKSTGSSYERFMNLGLREGDIINVTYTNDVMPYVTKPECVHNDNNTNPLCKFITHCPDCGTELVLSKSGKTMLCPNEKCNSRIIARMSNMMQKLNLKDFGESRIIQLNKQHLCDIIDLTYDDVEFLGPTIAQNFINRMNELKTKPIYDYEIVGAIGFTDIGKKKWQLIFNNYTLQEFIELVNNGGLSSIIHIKGIGSSIVDTLEKELPIFERDIRYIMNMKNVKSSKGLSSRKSIRCSGFRNPQLMQELRDMGYDADDNASVTKTTDILLVPYQDYSSSKTKKAGPVTIIVPIDEFIANKNKFLQ